MRTSSTLRKRPERGRIWSLTRERLLTEVAAWPGCRVANPPGGLDALATAIDDTERLLKSLPDPPVTPHDIAEKTRGTSLRGKLYATVNALLPLAVYLRLQIRLQRALPWLVASGVVALSCLAVFGVLTHEKKADDKSSGIVVNALGSSPPATPVPMPVLPPLRPVLFLTGRAEVSDEGLVAVEQARNALRRHPESLLLIRAHADTVAPMSLNSALARKRAAAILELLTGAGGIAPARVYIAELPKTDLPTVTASEVDEQSNRSVEMALVRP